MRTSSFFILQTIKYSSMVSLSCSAIAENLDLAEELQNVSHNTLEQGTEIIKPVIGDVRDLESLRERTHSVRSAHVRYIQQVSEGVIDPIKELEKMLATTRSLLPDLQTIYSNFLSEVDIEKKTALAGQIVPRLQTIGYWLDSANHDFQQSYVITNEELKRLQHIDSQNPKPAKYTETDRQLELLTPEQQVTLLNIPMPIAVKAPAGTEVFFIAHNGGEFANGLSRMQITTDQNGMAHTYWLSRGNAIGGTDISVISPNCSNECKIKFQVKRLALAKFPMLELAKANLNTPNYEQLKQRYEEHASTLLEAPLKLPTLDEDQDS